LTVTVTADGTPPGAPTLIGGSSGQIAFASARSGTPQIYLINADGTSLQAITNIDAGACQPVWSPDGSRLAFISPCRGRGEFYENIYPDSSLYVINADGSDLRPLTAVPGDFDPAWSPDGKRIAFASLRDGRKEIYLLIVDTGVVTRLTVSTGDVENSQPAWSPDGTLIAYTVKRVDAYQVWVMKPTGQGKEQLVRSGQDLWDYLPIWSQDGGTIFFNQRNLGPTRPWLMSIRYADRATVEPVKLDLPTPIEDVEISPDGSWILFESTDAQGNRDIYYSTITGGNRTRITNDPLSDFDPAWRPAQPP
jgi:Tol biopolymer transport system component